MISVFYCTRQSNPKHKQHIIDTAGIKDIEVIEYVNNGEGLTNPYNKALKEAKYDIIVFLHDDLLIVTQNWGRRLINHFKRNPDYGILGVAGSKLLPASGQWWEKRNEMYGQVFHTHEGKTWLSKYSEHLGNKITQTVIVDGVFLSVHRQRIKVGFNLEIKGFHFYDVDFCFKNHLEGVKIGVHYDIRINHMSIGITNQEWEENRKYFVETNKDKLPIKLHEDFKERKLKLLVGCLQFNGLTGSEISTLETVKGLAKAGCDVSVISSNVSDKFKAICKPLGIKTYTLSEPPGFKRGDGKWGFNTPNGFEPSKVDMLYKIEDVRFDVIHTNHTPITEYLLKLYPDGIFVNIVRSEVIDLENPIIDDRIKRYIAIRPSIKRHMMDNFGIPEDKIDIIYNAFDMNRFKKKTLPSGTNRKVTLFVGTMDYLRRKAIEDLVIKCQESNKELWLVGKDTDGYGNALSRANEHVKYFPPTEKIEEFYYKCDETAGIFLGRTTIEGFLCGKPAIIYIVDKLGEIISSEFHPVPEDLSIFDLDSHIKKTIDTYILAYNTL